MPVLQYSPKIPTYRLCRGGRCPALRLRSGTAERRPEPFGAVYPERSRRAQDKRSRWVEGFTNNLCLKSNNLKNPPPPTKQKFPNTIFMGDTLCIK